jgi:hypothetical protein
VRAHDFAERLAWSEGVAATEGDLFAILRARIPGCISVERATEEDDRSGTDYWAHRARGLRPLSIDLKARSLDPIESFGVDDLALETWSVIGEKPGWTRDSQKATDYILWLWTPTRRFFLVPFPALCNVFQRYWEQWAATYPVHGQDSGCWQSQCVLVPRVVLIETLNRWMQGAAA